ncbi:unnamed protein product [Lupinus luteus]|uniref:Uncharacterized protein n=1 Tax=Lupinus luteus TaxID=3873 RepID=A0AAV1WDH6_LUPLU
MELLSPLKHRKFEIKNEYEGREKIRHFLSHMKVLIVLDDVSDKRQLDNLVGKHEWFGKGSRVIITTRDKHLLTPKRLFRNYDIEMLNSDESLKLLCLNAFHNDQPEAGFLDLSKGICNLCGGLPLALEVMGSFLCERSELEWQDALNRMEQNEGDGDVILKTLQISYDGLRKGDRAIFLDIACFFNNMEENMLRTFLKDCGLNSILGLNMLLEKSLVCYNKTRIRMHDMLVQLGKTIVLDESPNDAGKQSRLWSQKDIDKVMGENEGGKEIQGIVFTSPKPYLADWDENCFSEMKGLRLLVLQNVYLLHGLRSLPSALKVLVWEGYAMNALPHIAQSNELVSLMLPCSKLSQLWNNTQVLGKLRVMDLRHSKDLTTTPEFDRIPNLESLTLEGCVSLDQVHESLGNHKKLVKVDFTGCKNLTALPSKLWMNSLETLILTGCIKLENLPEFDENMQSLSMLHLENTAIAELPPSLGFLTSLSDLNLKGCENLVSFPDTMCNLKSFRILDISLCSQIQNFPENLNEHVHLEELHAGATAITEIPSYINEFKNLKILSFQRCKGTHSISFTLPLPLPPSFSGLSLLTELDLAFCNLHDESINSDFNCLSSLWKLNLMGNHFVNLPLGCMSNLLKLEQLNLSYCFWLQSLPQIPPKLHQFFATHCCSLKPLLDQQLWNLFASHHFQSYSTPNFAADFIFLMHGDEIPSWFLNRTYHCEDSVQSICNKSISITMEIPHDNSPVWSGIAVCLVLEELLPESMCLRSVYWYFRSPEYEGYTKRTYFKFYDGSENSKLFIAFFPFTDFNCWRHLRGGLNQRLQLTMYCKNETTLNGAPLSPEEEDGVVGIRGCGWRLLSKQDFETWHKTMGDCTASTSASASAGASAEIEVISSNVIQNERVSEISNGNNECQDEIEGEYENETEEPKSFFRTCFTLFMTFCDKRRMVSDEN